MKGWLNRHTALAVGVLILLAYVLLTYGIIVSQRQVRQNRSALVALCALRHDLDLRIDSSRAFLREHPYGVDGLTAALIRQSLRNSQRTRETLNVLDCKESQ